MDPRTIRAAIVAFALAFAGFAGIGIFLGFDAMPAVSAGLVLGALSGGMILGVARRAEGMAPRAVRADREGRDG
jgi:Kef-type K+ transport system membrane component KefB